MQDPWESQNLRSNNCKSNCLIIIENRKKMRGLHIIPIYAALKILLRNLVEARKSVVTDTPRSDDESRYCRILSD